MGADDAGLDELTRAAYSRDATEADRLALLAAEHAQAERVERAEAARRVDEAAAVARAEARAIRRRRGRRVALVAVAVLALTAIPVILASIPVGVLTGSPSSSPAGPPAVDVDGSDGRGPTADEPPYSSNKPDGSPLDLDRPGDQQMVDEMLDLYDYSDPVFLGQLGGWVYYGGRTRAGSETSVCLARFRTGSGEGECVPESVYATDGVGFNVGLPIDSDGVDVDVANQYATGRVIWSPDGELVTVVDDRER